MNCSVIIPARNSAQTIEGTLNSLINGKRVPDEIIVVDGCSTDNTKAIAEKYGCKVIVNYNKNVAAARQIGIENACFEIVAFTDSDCRPALGWLQGIWEHFRNDPSLSGVGGPIFLSHPTNKIQAYSANVFESIMHFPKESTFITQKKMNGAFAGANSAYKKEAILSIGGFRKVFTNHAEEIDLFWRLIDAHAKLLFDPEILVEHLGYPSTIQQLIHTNFNYGMASTKLSKYHIGKQIDLSLYALLFRSIISVLNPFDHDQWALLRALQLSIFIGAKLYSSLILRTINI